MKERENQNLKNFRSFVSPPYAFGYSIALLIYTDTCILTQVLTYLLPFPNIPFSGILSGFAAFALITEGIRLCRDLTECPRDVRKIM